MGLSSSYGHALTEIRRHLHDPRGRKAAVMVGAGFSRNAVHRIDPGRSLPTWQKLTESLAERLYVEPNERHTVLRSAGATSAATRLAEEFETAFGRSALIAFVRENIPDDQFEPSAVHRALLELPWSDVFTTNYDRLLETASRGLWRQYYEIVASAIDLPLVRRPRIVKLHGTLPELQNLVITEEDYRTYTRRQAALVATVQSSLVENILCLVGFSGDDPNFLAWTGWLRDEMRIAAPNTYLFTDRELKPFQQELLQRRHITAIPLDHLVGTGSFSYEESYRKLFEELARPVEPSAPSWNFGRRYVTVREPDVVKEPYPSESSVVDAAILWRKHRWEYKGWHVLHLSAQEKLWWATRQWFDRSLRETLAAYEAPLSLFVLRELVWRSSTALQPMQDDFVFKVLEPEMQRFRQWRSASQPPGFEIKYQTQTIPIAELDEAYAVLLLERLRHAREIADDDRFASVLSELRSGECLISTNSSAFAMHQEVLREISRLRHNNGKALLEAWECANADPIWTIRRAALCIECGLIALGTQLTEDALTRLRSVPASTGLDIRQLSAEGLALNLLHDVYEARRHVVRRFDRGSSKDADHSRATLVNGPQIEQILERLEELGRHGCDPNESWNRIRESLRRYVRGPETIEIRAGFDIGTHGRKFLLGGFGSELEAVYRAIRFIEEAAIPLMAPGRIIFAGEAFERAVATLSTFSPWEAAGLFLRYRDDKLAQKVLTRRCLLKLSAPQIGTLWNASLAALDEAHEHLANRVEPAEDSLWRDHFEVAVTTLGRLLVRCTETEIHEFVVGICTRLLDRVTLEWRLQGVVWECLTRAISCLGAEAVGRLLPTLLRTPVSPRFAAQDVVVEQWSDPVRAACQSIRDCGRRVALDSSAELIEEMLRRIAIAPDPERRQLCLRTAYLLEAEILSETQQQMFVDSLFARTDPYGLPEATGCVDTLVLSLPHRAGFAELDALRCKLLDDNAARSLWRELRRTRSPYRDSGLDERRDVNWTADDLSQIVVRSDQWLTAQNRRRAATDRQPTNPFQASDDDVVEFRDWLATLEHLVFLNPQASHELKATAEALIKRAIANGWVVNQAVAARSVQGCISLAEAEEDLRQAVAQRDTDNLIQYGQALVKWQALNSHDVPDLPVGLVAPLITAVEQRQHNELPLLLDVVRQVAEVSPQEWLEKTLERLTPSLMALLGESDYASADDGDRIYSLAECLEVRSSVGRLVRLANQKGIDTEVTRGWLDAILRDPFADVRKIGMLPA